MHCPMVDAWTKAVINLRRDNPAMVEMIEGMLRGGMKVKDAAVESGMPGNLVSAIRQAMEPGSDTSKRIAQWMEWRKWKDNELHEKRSRAQLAMEAKKKKRELKDQYWREGESYEDFVKKMRGEEAPSRRIPLLDYSDEREDAIEGMKERKAPRLYRKILRELLPVVKRAEILTRLANSPDDGVALRAMQMLHKLEGVERKPKEQRPEPAQGPMFSLSGGVGVRVAPVGDDEVKH